MIYTNTQSSLNRFCVFIVFQYTKLEKQFENFMLDVHWLLARAHKLHYFLAKTQQHFSVTSLIAIYAKEISPHTQPLYRSTLTVFQR